MIDIFELDTKDCLDLHFGNDVGLMLVASGLGPTPEDVAIGASIDFDIGIASAIARLKQGEINESGGIGISQLQQILDTSLGSDWTSSEGIGELYRVYSEITGENLYEEVFGERVEAYA